MSPISKAVQALTISTGLLCASLAGAATNHPVSTPAQLAEIREFNPDQFSAPTWDIEKLAQLHKEAVARGSRSIAGVAPASEDAMSPEYKALRDAYLGVKTPDQLDGLLETLEHTYAADEAVGSKMPVDWRFVAAQILPLRAYRGLAYKMVPLVTGPKTAHSMLITAVQQFAATLRIYLPSDRWEVLFKYVTEPARLDASGKSVPDFYPNGDRKGGVLNGKTFAIESDLQKFLLHTALPMLYRANTRLQAIDFGNQSVVWDSRLFFGSDTFKDDLDRYRVLRAPDYNLAVAALENNIASILFFCSYRFDNYLYLQQQIGRYYGFDGFFDGQPHGASAENRFRDVIARNNYQFPLINPKNAAKSFTFLRDATSKISLAWDEIKGRSTADNSSLLLGAINPYNGFTQKTVDQMNALVAGRTQITSRTTGDVVTVDVPAFFAAPPLDLTNLNPYGFEKGDELYSSLNGVRLPYKARNYTRGRATAWHKDAYSTLFPGIPTDADVATDARVLSEAWGGWTVTAPLSFFML